MAGGGWIDPVTVHFAASGCSINRKSMHSVWAGYCNLHMFLPAELSTAEIQFVCNILIYSFTLLQAANNTKKDTRSGYTGGYIFGLVKSSIATVACSMPNAS